MKKRKNIFKGFWKRFLNFVGNSTIHFTIGLFYTIYAILRGFYISVGNLYQKIPFVARMVAFYLIIGYVGFASYNFIKPRFKEVITEVKTIDYVIVDDNTCKLEKYDCMIAGVGKKYELTDDEIKMAISISRWETGNYASQAFKNNNWGGIYINGKIHTYETLEDGLNGFIKLLKYNYFGKGMTTLQTIQPIYCPVGADNDPNSLNQYWLKGTLKIYIDLLDKEIY